MLLNMSLKSIFSAVSFLLVLHTSDSNANARQSLTTKRTVPTNTQVADENTQMKKSCPDIVLEKVKGLDLTKSDGESLHSVFTWIESQSKSTGCVVDSLITIADRLNAQSDRQAIAAFCSTVATYAKFLKQEDLVRIKDSYLRFPYNPVDARDYFSGLENSKIDIRDHLKDKIKIDWSFLQLRQKDETWVYYRYLASLNEPQALEALAKKISTTSYGNDVGLFLIDLSESNIEGVDNIIRRYENDSRRFDSSNGPGLMISEWVKIHFQFNK